MNLKKINFYIVNKKKLSLFYNDNNKKEFLQIFIILDD